MITAILDLGSNTFNLLVYDFEKESMLFSEKLPVKIGQSGYKEKTITQEAMNRSTDVLQKHLESAKVFGATDIVAFGTSAIRSANNKNEFVSFIKDETSIEINVINGIQEAELIYQGVNQTLSSRDQDYLIMDIGGGSTEFILVKDQNPVWMHSFDLGVSRILEYVKPKNPLNQVDNDKLHELLELELAPLMKALEDFPIKTLIGASGSFESFFSMLNFDEQKSIGKVLSFESERLMKLMGELVQSTLEERLNRKGLVKMRSDTIHLAAALCLYLQKQYNFTQIKYSDYSLKEGVIMNLKENTSIWQRSLL
ncbi:MAG: hypothetical protein N4A46_16780 [Schleiferiaceae bacterium]|nr:hypothetical protein [Schleiferiaceae bacterium]